MKVRSFTIAHVATVAGFWATFFAPCFFVAGANFYGFLLSAVVLISLATDFTLDETTEPRDVLHVRPPWVWIATFFHAVTHFGEITEVEE